VLRKRRPERMIVTGEWAAVRLNLDDLDVWVGSADALGGIVA
jgi:hypothetical protein